MCSPMPDDDPLADHPEMYPERHVPPVCSRYPTCESPENDWYGGAQDPCTWPDCFIPPTKGTP